MRRAAALLAIRPGEGRLVALLAALFATVEAGRGVGEVGADTLFLSRFGAEALPYLFVMLGGVTLVAALGYGAGIGRLGHRRFLVGLLVGAAGLLLVERAAIMAESDLVLPAIWISVYAVGALLLTTVWTVAGSTLDMRQAKRLFPACTSAAILGGFAGTLSAGPLARVLGTENLLLLYVVLLIGAAILTAATLGRGRRPVQQRSPGSVSAELRIGYDFVRRSPLMRLVALAYVLFAVLLFSISFPFLRAMGDAFDSEADLATALGLLAAAVTGASFLISIALTNRLFTRFGVAGAALLLPLVYLGGFVLWFVQFSLTTAIVVRFAQQVTQRGVSNAAWSAMYNVLPADRRPQVLAFMDGVPGQVGIALSGVLLLVGGALLAPTQIFAIGAVAAIACIWVVLRIRARYGQALLETLRSGLGEQVLEGGPGLEALTREPRVLPELRREIASSHPGSRRLAVDLLGRLGTSDDGAALVAALSDAEPEVRGAAIRSIATLNPSLLERHAAPLIDDPDPRVRAELAVWMAGTGDRGPTSRILDDLVHSPRPDDRVAGMDALARLGGHRSVETVSEACQDPSPQVRAVAVRALCAASDPDVPPPAPVLAALDDDAPLVRRAASAALARHRGATSALLGILSDGSERAQSAAIGALAGRSEEMRPPLRNWALERLRRAEFLRRRAMSRSADSSATEEFLCFVVEQRERRIEEAVLAAIAALGAPEANGPIRRALRSRDADVRAQAVEALDALGDRQLGGAIVRLLDSDHDRVPIDEVLGSMLDDPDAWIRALALRLSVERSPGAWPVIRERVETETDPIVSMALGDHNGVGGRALPDTERTLTEIERMMFLRRVPLFSKLAPEDLQRIAATARERLYARDEAIMREGDLGDELVVIVEGDVSVVTGEGEDRRLIRTYQAGDHIGELAVLRDQPRAATVIAGTDGVRGLVIAGEGLRAILTERPEAAMAMLATLADRISAQVPPTPPRTGG
jgi:HEAT repeat protein/ATP/ADP translocase